MALVFYSFFIKLQVTVTHNTRLKLRLVPVLSYDKSKHKVMIKNSVRGMRYAIPINIYIPP